LREKSRGEQGIRKEYDQKKKEKHWEGKRTVRHCGKGALEMGPEKGRERGGINEEKAIGVKSLSLASWEEGKGRSDWKEKWRNLAEAKKKGSSR